MDKECLKVRVATVVLKAGALCFLGFVALAGLPVWIGAALAEVSIGGLSE